MTVGTQDSASAPALNSERKSAGCTMRSVVCRVPAKCNSTIGQAPDDADERPLTRSAVVHHDTPDWWMYWVYQTTQLHVSMLR